MQTAATDRLQQRLRNRHIQLIGLGGAVGTGLFLGSARVLQLAGPSMLLGYVLVGGVVFLIMRFVGEMLVEKPVSSSFSYFAGQYLGPFAGFFAGWNNIALYVLAGMLELTAAGTFMQFWWPALPAWITAACGLALITAMNLTNVRVYGELESGFALLKLVAVVAMIVFGFYLLVAHYGSPGVGLPNLWSYGGFIPSWSGLVQATGLIALSYVGLEMMTFAAAETEEPRRSIPKAINQIAWRILIFYVGSTFVLLTIFPWPTLVQHMQDNSRGIYGGSPFALLFSAIGANAAANLLNAVILVAALSVYNSAVYSTSRLLYGMALQGDAPPSLGRTNARGVPVRALLLSALVTAVAVGLNYVVPSQALELLIALITTTFVCMWTVMIVTHMKFRAACREAGTRTLFPAPLAPWSHLLCLGFVALLVGVLYVSPGTRVGAVAVPVWVAVVWLGYRTAQRVKAGAGDAQTGTQTGTTRG